MCEVRKRNREWLAILLEHLETNKYNTQKRTVNITARYCLWANGLVVVDNWITIVLSFARGLL